MSETQPVKILICAMGGEGGGVLMNWIVNAAWAKGYPVQATSVPGVAQRTGATTYYIEMLPEAIAPGAPEPIFALIPTAGEVDVLVATEAAEAARAAGNGLITPDRTHLIASTSRVLLMPEKMAMEDGRLDNDKLAAILDKSAQKSVLFDANQAAQEAGAIVNAVMLGAVAATGVIGIELDDFIAAIKQEGKAVSSNIAGLNKGFALAKGEAEEAPEADNVVSLSEQRAKNDFPENVQPILQHALRRLNNYQNTAYAENYLARLENFKDSDPELLVSVAKQLALRMSYEDIIRVAQVKVRAERFERIKGEAKAAPEDVLIVTDFFKPGIAEISDMLPTGLAKSLIAWGEKNGKMEFYGIGMEVKTTTITGFLKLWFLAKLKWWRPHSHRWQVEQANIDDWLDMVDSAATLNANFAAEIAELARLVKGYGSTHRRGLRNFSRIVEEYVRPVLTAGSVPSDATEKLRDIRDAATKDPEGSALGELLAKIGSPGTLAAE
ncbi:MAG: indolepyruvate oxidoreductase subunit beta family protein [Rhodospirillaceae bacterium]|nr:indolepyruvate oxidoreductase subunit beta family protein [Rhodospirillaceae bacterium]MBT4940220.1 indolepyruvate oxidoreductase subunit beta family protein [Rhodospirillaceae bacterium]